MVGQEVEILNVALGAERLNEIIQKFPVRSTPALAQIATGLGFRDTDQYEAAVLHLLSNDADALATVKDLFGDVVTNI
jgi:hypothetical protein